MSTAFASSAVASPGVSPTMAVSGVAAASKYRSQREHIVVSYSHHNQEDVAWITGELVPRIKSCGLSVFLDVDSIEAGVDWRARIADAIAKCQHVVLVLTPEWAQSEECRFEASGAFQLDPWGVKQKLVPVQLRDCFALLPEWLRRRHILDFRSAAGREALWKQLLAACLTSLPEEASYGAVSNLTQIAFSTVHSMGELSGLLVPTRKRIEEVIGFKELHDTLHQLELPWGLTEDVVRRLALNADDRSSWRELRTHVTTSLEPVTGELANRAARQLGKKADSVVAALRRGALELVAILAERQAVETPVNSAYTSRLDDVASRIRKELSRQSTRLNDWIVNSVRDIALDDLAPPVKELLHELEQDGGERQTYLIGRLNDFLEVIEDLQGALSLHIDSHDVLQGLHDELLHVAPDDWDEREDFRSVWLGPQDKLAELRKDKWRDMAWACEIVEAGEGVDRLLKLNALNLDDARDKFEDFRSRVFKEFRAVDIQLRQFCALRLKPLGDQLANALTSGKPMP